MVYIEHLKNSLIIRLRAEDDGIVGDHQTVLRPGGFFSLLSYDKIKEMGEGAIDPRIFDEKEQQQ